MLRIRVAACSRQSAEWFSDALTSRGIANALERGTEETARVCYGWGLERDRRADVPTLNAKAGQFSKLSHLRLMRDADVRTIPFAENATDAARLQFPLLARINSDGNGKDIVPVFQPEEIDWRIASGARYFTQYISRSAEYRFWVFRDRILATYIKTMRHPERYHGIGANHKDGFEHVFIDRADSNRALWPIAIAAVKAVDLDFGGADILLGKDGLPYVLEVNSAPGANGPRAVGLTHLAEEVAKWYQTLIGGE